MRSAPRPTRARTCRAPQLPITLVPEVRCPAEPKSATNRVRVPRTLLVPQSVTLAASAVDRECRTSVPPNNRALQLTESVSGDTMHRARRSLVPKLGSTEDPASGTHRVCNTGTSDARAARQHLQYRTMDRPECPMSGTPEVCNDVSPNRRASRDFESPRGRFFRTAESWRSRSLLSRNSVTRRVTSDLSPQPGRSEDQATARTKLRNHRCSKLPKSGSSVHLIIGSHGVPSHRTNRVRIRRHPSRANSAISELCKSVRLQDWKPSQRVARAGRGAAILKFRVDRVAASPEVFLCASCRLRTRREALARPQQR